MIKIQANGPECEVEVQGELGDILVELAQASFGIIEATAKNLCTDPNELMEIYREMLEEIKGQDPEITVENHST